MRIVEYDRYGQPDVLSVKEVEIPAPAADEIRIRVQAANVTTVDCIFRRGDQVAARMFTGMFKPGTRTPGSDFAGEVESVGSAVTRFKPGDRVVGSTTGFGSNAQYVVVLQSNVLAPIPESTSFQEAASLCEGMLTSLPFLREGGQLAEGHRVLINGASGSLGTASIQIAKHFGAVVTAVCGPSNRELVESLGADQVIDYTTSDFARSGQTWDVIFDTIGKTTFSHCRHALTAGGRYLQPVISLGILVNMVRTSVLGTRKAVFMATGARSSELRQKDLDTTMDLVAKGKAVSVIDRTYPIDEVVAAHRHVETGHKKGNVILELWG